MDAPDPILVRLVHGLGRQPVDHQVFGRAPVAETVSQDDFDAADLSDLLHARELGLALAQRAFGRDALGRLDRGHQHAADARWRGVVRHRAVAQREERILRLAAMTADAQRQILGEESAALAREHRPMQRRELLLQLPATPRETACRAPADASRPASAGSRHCRSGRNPAPSAPPSEIARRGSSRRSASGSATISRAGRAASRPIMRGDPRGHFAARGAALAGGARLI